MQFKNEETALASAIWSTQKSVLGALGALMLAACASGQGGQTSPSSKGRISGPPVYKANQLMGARADELDALLGAPALTRREGAGEYRRYGLSGCTLIVILYPDDTGVSRAALIEAAALKAGAAPIGVDECLALG